MRSPAAVMISTRFSQPSAFQAGCAARGRGDGVAHIPRVAFGEATHEDVLVDGGAQLELAVAGAFLAVDDVGVRLAQACAGGDDARLEGGVQLLVVRAQGGVGDLDARCVGHGLGLPRGVGLMSTRARRGSASTPRVYSRAALPDGTLAAGNQDGRPGSPERPLGVLEGVVAAQAVRSPRPPSAFRAWTVRKQSEQ